MVTYDDEDRGYEYHLGSSTSNIFVENDNGSQVYLLWLRNPFVDSSHFHFPLLYTRFTLCSSSQGLISCRDSLSNYYIGNPFAQGQNAYILLPPPPRTHHSYHTSVVLATEFVEDAAPLAFHLICAVRVMAKTYIFDTYSSLDGRWFSNLWVLRSEIYANTGVSCGGTAYWVCEQRGVSCGVVGFDAVSKKIRNLELPYPYQIFAESMSEPQLGRVGNRLGLVVVRQRPSPGVELHVHGENGWEHYTSLGVDICAADTARMGWVAHNNIAPRTSTVGGLHRPAGRIVCRELPRPLRFESFKMEVLLWVDGWLAVWVNSSDDPRRDRVHMARILEVGSRMPSRFVDAIPHVRSSWLPGHFLNLQVLQ